MGSTPQYDLYAPNEIARAAGVPEADVIAALGGVRRFVGHSDAVRLGRHLVRAAALRRGQDAGVPPGVVAPAGSLFGIFSGAAASRRPTGVPLALSSTLHASLIAFAIFLATFNLSPRAAVLRDDIRPDPMRLVFLATPGPGGGGGGGGLLQKAPPPKALREGRRAISSPVPVRQEPKPIAPAPAPPEPKPEPLKSEPLPAVVAPIITAPADTRNRVGVLDQTPVE